MDKQKIEEISILTIQVLKSRLDSVLNINPTTLRNMPFHTAFLKAFYDKLGFTNDDEAFKSLSLYSWFQGLSTTLGQSYFEKVAHILMGGCKKTFKGYSFIGDNASKKITDIMKELKDGTRIPDLEKENRELKDAISKSKSMVKGLDFTADVYYEDNEKVIMIELKSVRPNAGEMRGEKEKILNAKAYLMSEKVDKEIYYYIGFPFDPTESPTNPYAYNKERFMNSLVEFKKYFAKEELLIGSELWDFLSGEPGTMAKILEIINAIATPEFGRKFNIINTFTFVKLDETNKKLIIDNKIFGEYINILKSWNLYSEIEFAENLKTLIVTNSKEVERKKLKSLLKRKMFNADNKYNKGRKSALS